MTRYAIYQDRDGLTIPVTETGTGGDRLLAEFQECQEGRCDCHTDEYDKVSTLSVDTEGSDGITLRLVPKPGQRFDESEIDACLQHTRSQSPWLTRSRECRSALFGHVLVLVRYLLVGARDSAARPRRGSDAMPLE